MTATDDSASASRTSSEVALARIPQAPSVELQALVVRAVVVALGAASLLAAVVTHALARSLRVDAAGLEHPGDAPSVLGRPPRVVGALFGVAVEAARWSTRGTSPVGRRLGRLLSFAGDLPPIRLAGSRLEDIVTRLDASWEEERPRREEAASAFIDALMTEIVGAMLDHIDLTSLALERIDMDRFLDAMDVNSIVDRVDVERALERVDLNDVVERIDVDRILARVDVDELAGRMDLDAMIQRLELARIAQQVIDELDVGEIIRDSTGSMATETVEGIRVQGMNADRLVSRLVDRAFGRRGNDDATPGGNGASNERAR
jgi:hypothetical protein